MPRNRGYRERPAQRRRGRTETRMVQPKRQPRQPRRGIRTVQGVEQQVIAARIQGAGTPQDPDGYEADYV